ncbi:sequence-specific DNA-binding high mobility group box protein, partial [Syncephalis fuscata]
MTRDGRAPRPLNCFMTYRRDKHAQVMREQGHRCNNKFISKIIGDMWKLEPEEVKAAYKRKAAEGAKQHELAFPDYKYRPRSKQER